MLKSVREHCLAALEVHPTHIMENIGRYANMVEGGEEKRLYWEMTLSYGVAQTKATAQWAQDCIDKIENAGAAFGRP